VRTRIIVPHRGLDSAKSRLASVLSPEERVLLGERLLRHVVGTAVSSLGPDDDLMVISPSLALADIVGPMGASLTIQHGMGLNEGLEQARAAAADARVDILLVLHGDLPKLRGADIAALVRAIPPSGGVAIAPDRAGSGTNGLAMMPIDAIPFRFGRGSFSAHSAEAERAGCPLVAVNRSGLAFDLDTPDDLRRWLEMGDAA
jgi:2-phospho-L-lactate/phosphoenolpyruvate guanylyltransferase